MSRFEVTWQMTGTIVVEADDDLDAKSTVECLSDTELVQAPGEPPVAIVIATKIVS